MSKPHPTQTGLSRRTALAGVLALAGSATPALAAYATPDDAELLQVVQAGLEAHTLAGLQAKARLALAAMPLNRNGTVSPGAPEYLAWSLCRDLLGVAA
ncbi:MAG: hypothetical protein ABF916_09345 [Acetobacter fabarum]|uniref:hypothetical protein n=1 Tax=Acetobacter fabarum TaxID=483199 RepID=UPI0039ED57E1